MELIAGFFETYLKLNRQEVESMWLILQQEEPGDYVIATNETHTVQEFVANAFAVADLNWQNYVSVDEKFFRPLDVHYLQGDPGKANKKLHWQPKIKFDQLVEIMVK